MLGSFRCGVVAGVGVLCLAPALATAAAVQWTHPASGLWQTPGNWSSSPALPGAADDVLIDRPGDLEITLSSGSQSIRQLTAEEMLTITSAAELLVGAGGGTINGALTVTSGRLVSQAGGTLTVNGVVNTNVAGLRALSGGVLNVPNLVTINAPSNLAAIYDAQGANSRLDLSSVTTFTGGTSTSPTTVTALNGGRVELENVATISTGATFLVANGASSIIDLTDLALLGSDNPVSPARLQAVGGGTLITPNLATVGLAVVEVQNATSTINLATVTSANGATFRTLSGGQIAMPILTSYAAGSAATEFFATGTGSVIDLSNVTTLSGSTVNSLVVSAGNNALLDLSGVTSMPLGAVNLVASTGSVIDLSSLASYNATNLPQVRRLRADGGGTVRLNSSGTTTVTNARVELESNGNIMGDRLELGVGATLAVNGTFGADLANTAGVVAVGGAAGTTTIGGDFSQAVEGTIQVQLGGTTAGTQFDRLIVNGAAQLSGGIHVSLINGYTPAAGASFEVLQAAGGISGELQVTWSGAIPWIAEYDLDSVTL